MSNFNDNLLYFYICFGIDVKKLYKKVNSRLEHIYFKNVREKPYEHNKKRIFIKLRDIRCLVKTDWFSEYRKKRNYSNGFLTTLRQTLEPNVKLPKIGITVKCMYKLIKLKYILGELS